MTYRDPGFRGGPPFLAPGNTGQSGFGHPLGGGGWQKIKHYPLIKGATGATTQSTTVVNLVVMNNLRIPQDRSIMICGVARKTDGAAASAILGLTLNATAIVDTTSAANGAQALWTGSAINEVTTGNFWAVLGARNDTNYARNGLGLYTQYGDSMQRAILSLPCATVAQPLAIITSLTITGRVENASILLGVNEVDLFMSGF